jgi:hypothetical protein
MSSDLGCDGNPRKIFLLLLYPPETNKPRSVRYTQKPPEKEILGSTKGLYEICDLVSEF